MAEYADKISELAIKPREYLEHQLHMSDEEKEDRAVFFTEFFAKHSDREVHVA